MQLGSTPLRSRRPFKRPTGLQSVPHASPGRRGPHRRHLFEAILVLTLGPPSVGQAATGATEELAKEVEVGVATSCASTAAPPPASPPAAEAVAACHPP